jgi:hypothetical protein
VTGRVFLLLLRQLDRVAAVTAAGGSGLIAMGAAGRLVARACRWSAAAAVVACGLLQKRHIKEN